LSSNSNLPIADHPYATEYQRDGFLIASDLLPTDIIDPLRDRITAIGQGQVPTFPREDIEFEPHADGQESLAAIRKINRCAENDSVFMSAASDPRILDIVESLIGPDVKLFGSQCFMKPPGGIEKPYHQDSAYFPIEPLSLVTCWIALDEVTRQNGCMWVIPGSHLGPLHHHSQPWEIGGRIDMQVPGEKIDRDLETPITMSAGSCSFHHSKLLHRSGRNRTQSQRRGLAIHYMSAQSRWTDPNADQPLYRLLRGNEFPDCI
jgi:ectoine hydroxylase-related dioxygenase (phytanoyl-CoA dioxygenase family)